MTLSTASAPGAQHAWRRLLCSQTSMLIKITREDLENLPAGAVPVISQNSPVMWWTWKATIENLC